MVSENTFDRETRSPPANRRGKKRLATVVACAALLLAVAVVFGQTVGFRSINLDDDICVFQNPRLSHGLTWNAVGWSFTNRLVGNWDPLTWISHAADWQCYGAWAGGHHLTNVLLHAIAAILLFLVLRRMTDRAWPGFVAAAIWAVHPLRVESVAWITERKDVLSGVFFLLILAAYVAYARRPGVIRYFVVLILFTLGLMAKPMLATVPVVLLLLDYWPLGRSKIGRLIVEKLPLLAPVAGCAAVTFWAQKVVEYEYGSLQWRVGNALISYVVYLRQFFWPADLALLYPRRPPALPFWQVCGAGILLVAVTAVAWGLRRKHPYLLVGWLWYLVMLAPVVGFVPFGNQAPADRFTYLPQIGLCIAVVWTAADVCRSRAAGRWAFGLGAAAIVAALMVCSVRQTSYWRDNATLWARSFACTADNYLVHGLLAADLAVRGHKEAAAAEFHKALAVKPDYAAAHYGLGVAAAVEGRMDEAIRRYRKALEGRPNYAGAHNNLANALLLRGEIGEAIEHCQRAIAADPELAEAHYNLGNALMVLRRFDKAAAEFEQAIQLRPDYAEAHANLAFVLFSTGRLDDAAAQCREALRIKPDFASAREGLRKIDAARRRGEGG